MRERWRRALGLGLSLVIAVVVSGPAWAGTPTEQLRSQIERVLKTLEDPELRKDSKATERRSAVRKLAEGIFDFEETARRSLGRHWAARTPAEREEFVRLFADLLERSYLTKMEIYGGEKIQYVGDAVDAGNATVKTKIVAKGGTEIPVDYKMLRKADRWLVYDVAIEGVSLVSNYRTQFNKIIQTSSYQELVRKLKTKHEEFLEEQKRTSQR
ncbi:MAG: ABC transporter substrate-binding protein [Candidatus Rokubacteria bacterium]|nr:ABC transporter substrate-binding protein [Candidatus Rokubacteria bacterium]